MVLVIACGSQQTEATLLKGIPGVAVYLDDVLITGSMEAKHLKKCYRGCIRQGYDFGVTNVFS